MLSLGSRRPVTLCVRVIALCRMTENSQEGLWQRSESQLNPKRHR
jgi:hypothetical protein